MSDSWEKVGELKDASEHYARLALRASNNGLTTAADRLYRKQSQCDTLASAMTDRLLSRHAEPAVAVPGHIPDYAFTLDSKRITYDGASLAQAISRAMR